jgi:FtsH-binding integral membrane protein
LTTAVIVASTILVDA